MSFDVILDLTADVRFNFQIYTSYVNINRMLVLITANQDARINYCRQLVGDLSRADSQLYFWVLIYARKYKGKK